MNKLIYLIIGAILLAVVGIFVLSLSTKNNTVKNNNPVQTPKTAISSTPIPVVSTPIPVPPGTLFVTSDGVAPKQIELKVGTALTVTNNTLSEATVKTSGVFSKDIVVPAQKTIKTEIINNSGEIKAWVESNKLNVATITVK